mmetsp:Transcript_3763/g.3201  ORF Transcript_3763/g.3201 Transcript_3763/m.3201 type:complete len:98 (-) Transcript_3763:340-633(-)
MDKEETVLAGVLLGNATEVNGGENTYTRDGLIYSAIAGLVKNEDKDGIKKVSVVSRNKTLEKQVFFNIGSLVYGRVLYIKEDLAIVRIIAIENTPVE